MTVVVRWRYEKKKKKPGSVELGLLAENHATLHRMSPISSH